MVVYQSSDAVAEISLSMCQGLFLSWCVARHLIFRSLFTDVCALHRLPWSQPCGSLANPIAEIMSGTRWQHRAGSRFPTKKLPYNSYVIGISL